MGELRSKSRAFSIRVCRLFLSKKLDFVTQILARQLVRSATSVSANHSASMRARSRTDMIAKMKIVEEEIDECLHWLDLMNELGVIPAEEVAHLQSEAKQILAMTVASIATLRKKETPAKPRKQPPK